MNVYHQQYICQKPLCDKNFQTEEELIEHLKKCFDCSKCGKYFGSVEGFKSHQEGCEFFKINYHQGLKEILEDEIIPVETEEERNFNLITYLLSTLMLVYHSHTPVLLLR